MRDGIARAAFPPHRGYAGALALCIAFPASSCTGPSRPPAVDRPPVVWIVVDALRPDHLGVYGYARDTDPNLQEFARGAVAFARAYAAAPKTVPSVAQMLTSARFPDSAPGTSFMRWAADAGYRRSLAVVNNPYASKWIARQQPTFDAVIADPLDARALTDRAVEWIREHATEPFVVYLHYLDSHTPYRVPVAYASAFADLRHRGEVGFTFDDVAGAWAGRFDAADRRRIEDLYDGTILYVDEQLARVFEVLRETGRYEESLVVVTSDHGEEFWEHGGFFHGQSLYEELIRVPLLVKFPGGWRAGTTVRTPVSLVDVLPTVADAATPHARADETWNGVSLLQRMHRAPADAAVFATVGRSDATRPPRHALVRGTSKIVRNLADGSIELYDLAADPGETENLSVRSPDAVRSLSDALAGFLEPLWKEGYFVELSNPGPRPADFALHLATDPPQPMVDVDVRPQDGAGNVRLQLGDKAQSIALAATVAAGGTVRARFDVLGRAGTLAAGATVDGRAVPVAGLAGADAAPLEDGIAEEPPVRSSEGPAVSLWRTPGARNRLAPTLSEEERRRLRALGYLE